MNNPDDQSVPSPPNTIPIVVSSDDSSASPPSSEANTIPIVVDPEKDRQQSLPSLVPSPITIAVEPDDVVMQPPQPPHWVRPDDVVKPPQPTPVQFETVLIAEKLNKYLADGTSDLNDVSFKLLKGELTCIMGKDEDGVLSLLRVLALEEAVTTGRLTILNKEISGLSNEERDTFRDTHIAYIRQSHLGLVEQTGRMLVAYWLHYYDDLRWDEAKEYAGLALNDVGITHHLGDIPIRKLSIADVSRISIAKIYARSRRHRCIYLFEDLFTSLDQKSADELVQLLQAVARQGKVVVAKANRQDIASSFDRVLEMQDGELVQVR